MLTFLRKVRKSLIETGSVRRYLLYATGEVLLVMVGILLALQINNWNEERKKDALEIEYLSGIKQDLEADIPTIARRRNGIARRISILHQIDSTYLPILFQPYEISLDSVDIHFVFRRGSSVRLTMGSYNTLISNASVGLIRNSDLLQSIQALYESRYPGTLSVYDDIKKREEHIGWKYAYELKNADIKTFFIDNPKKKEVLADFNFYYRTQELMYSVLMNMQEDIVKVIESINAEITRLQ